MSDEWNDDMEAAPKDGTPFLGWSDEGVAYVCWSFWRTEDKGLWRFFDTGRGDSYSFRPTHWRPLPEPPLSPAKEGS